MHDRSQYLPHNELSDLKRQITFNETMKVRMFEKAQAKAEAYDKKIQRSQNESQS